MENTDRVVTNVENNSTDTLFKIKINSNIVFNLGNNSNTPLVKDLENVLWLLDFDLSVTEDIPQDVLFFPSQNMLILGCFLWNKRLSVVLTHQSR